MSSFVALSKNILVQPPLFLITKSGLDT